MKAMRILLASQAFPPSSLAGVEVYTLRLANALLDLGHEVRVFTAVHDLAAAPGSSRQRLHEGLVIHEVVNVHHRGTLESTYDDPEIDAAARLLILEFKPDVVHLQHLLNLSAGIVAVARQAGARVLYTLHDYWLSCPRDGLRQRADLELCVAMDHDTCAACLRDSPYLVPAAQRGLASVARRAGLGRQLHRLHQLAPAVTATALRLLRDASPPAAEDLARAMDRRAARLRSVCGTIDGFVAPTRFARDRAVEFGVPAARVRVSAYGAVVEPFRPRRSGPRRRIGYVGTLAPHKGVHVLLEAFRGLSAEDVTLDVYGNPSVQPHYVQALRTLAATDSRIRFRGAFGEGGQQDAYAELDVLVVPSLWWENSPLTILEALSQGLVVIASATGGVPELIADGATGLLVPPGDSTALRGALDDVVSGRRLSEARAPLALKTVAAGARELLGLYSGLLAAG